MVLVVVSSQYDKPELVTVVHDPVYMMGGAWVSSMSTNLIVWAPTLSMPSIVARTFNAAKKIIVMVDKGTQGGEDLVNFTHGELYNK